MVEPEERGQRLRVVTGIREFADGWYCFLEVEEVLGGDAIRGWELGPADDDPIFVGPFHTRKIARRELKGPFREIVTRVVQRYAKARNGTIELLDFNNEPEEQTN